MTWREQSALITLCLLREVRLAQVAQSSNQQNFYSQLKATNPSCLGGKNSAGECKYYQRQQSTSQGKQEKNSIIIRNEFLQSVGWVYGDGDDGGGGFGYQK